MKYIVRKHWGRLRQAKEGLETALEYLVTIQKVFEGEKSPKNWRQKLTNCQKRPYEVHSKKTLRQAEASQRRPRDASRVLSDDLECI